MNDAPSILLADDSADDIFLLEQAFKKAGLPEPFHAVRNGEEVIAYLEGTGIYRDRAAYPFPDVLLLDLNMPRRTGLEVLEWIRKDTRCSRLMVHILSSSARETDIARAYDLRANSYVIKPTRMDQLIAFVKALHTWHQFTVTADCSEKRTD